jgi:hypothetical protein
MLDKVCALRFDEQEAWRDEEFKSFPPAEEFVIKTLGAWRLQEARQKRLLGVEGEIHRLEKALAGGERTDLTGRYDSPAVGRLVDEMLRHFDAREAAVAKAAETEMRDKDAGHDILDSVYETRDWNWSARARVEQSLHEAAGIQTNLTNLANGMAGSDNDTQGLKDVVAGVRKDLEAIEKTMAAGGPGKAEATELNDLVDRGSKLAFQIAMEVTRLGPRGDRLTPMSQALEDLTTGFRKVVDSLPFSDGEGSGSGVTKKLAAKLDNLDNLVVALGEDDADGAYASLEQVIPVAAKIAKDLDSLADDFSVQGDRVDTMGSAVADLTGQDYDSSEAPARSTTLDDLVPLELVKRSQPASIDDGLSSGGFEVERNSGFSMDSGAETQEPLSDMSEEVYDLDSFDASPVMESEPDPVPEVIPEDIPEDQGTTDEVFELDTFGAEPLMTAAPDAGDEETVYDLDQFGADPVANDGEDLEPVYEMADLGGSEMVDANKADIECGDEIVDLGSLGAVSLDAPSATDEEDEVLDLNDFGALPLD